MQKQVYVMVICLASIVGTSAAANTLTKRDAQIVASLGKQAHGIEEDIHQYNVGRAFAPKNTEYVVQSTCWREMFLAMEAVSMALNHDGMSITVSSEMVNPHDEAISLVAVKADTEGAIVMIGTTRQIINYVLGACSSDALIVSKSQQTTNFLDQADTVLRSLEGRLPLLQ
jgi:hypothetical protein